MNRKQSCPAQAGKRRHVAEKIGSYVEAQAKRGVLTCAPRVTRLSVLSEDTTRFAGLGLISFHSPFNAAGEAFSLCNFPR